MWNAAQAPLLYQPTLVGNVRMARNPVTGEILPLVYVGRLVPGTGNFTNGMVVFEGTPQQKNPFKVAPRIGFAWDVTGDGRTAVRGGAGVFYDRYSDDNILDLIELPPLLQTFTTNYTTVSELLASPLTATPTGVRLIQEFVPPVVYNWSLGVQRDIGWNLVGDVAYVGNAARDQLITRQINGRPYGYAYQPSSLDPTNVSGGVTQPLPNDLLRPIRGYAGDRTARVHRLLRLPLDAGLGEPPPLLRRAVGGRVLHLPAGEQDPRLDRSVHDGPENRARNYNSNGRRPHTLMINYAYEVPNLSSQVGQPHHQGDLRQLADLRHHLAPERSARRLRLYLLERADRRAERQRGDRRRRQPARHPVRPDPAAGRADVRPAVQDGVHRAADRSVQLRHGRWATSSTARAS